MVTRIIVMSFTLLEELVRLHHPAFVKEKPVSVFQNALMAFDVMLPVQNVCPTLREIRAAPRVHCASMHDAMEHAVMMSVMNASCLESREIAN